MAHLKGKVNGLTVLNGDARLTFNDQGLLLNMSNGLPPVATFTRESSDRRKPITHI